jgi:hypothetical protein
MRFGTWNVSSLTAVKKEISKYKIDLVRVQVVRLHRSDTEPAGECTFFHGKGQENHELGTGVFLLHKRIITAFKRVEFVSHRISYVILRWFWCDIIVLNISAPAVNKIHDMKDSFYVEQERVFDEFPKQQMKIF